MRETLKLRRLSFGAPAAVITSMALLVGLDAATARKATVAGSLLIAGLADNLTDSLSVHIYQESERMPQSLAFRTTAANFFARLVISLSFIVLFLTLPAMVAVYACVLWGFFVLSWLSYLLAKARHVSPLAEIYKHAGVAALALLLSKVIGTVIQRIEEIC
ncbi:MAG TPA: hypothetical protein VFF88_01190 [Methylocella sp.]|nr:hypothetical protein [Methylocella sp.]